MKIHKFVDDDPNPKIAVLIKESSFNVQALAKHYVDPLVQVGIDRSSIIACSLEYTQNKASAALIKDWIATWLQGIKDSGITHILCADANYFKALVKESKAEPFLGIAKPCAIAGCEDITIFYSLGYGALVHNPNQEHKITNSLYALSTHYQGNYTEVGADIIKTALYPQLNADIASVLKSLHQYPELVVDIETFSLELKDAGLGSIGFAWNKHEGTSFLVDYLPIQEEGGVYGVRRTNHKVRNMLKQFFENYKGKLIAHNASFDFKNLIHCLWMKDPLDWKGMIHGLKVLTRSFDDTKIIAYLALNSCAKQEYGLKILAQPFAGNWAESEIKDIRKIHFEDLLKYNLVDCLSTWYVKETYEPIMIQDNQQAVYRDLFLPTLITIIQMECHGTPLNPTRVQEVKAELLVMQSNLINLLDTSMYVADATDRIQENAMLVANAKLKKKVKPRHEFTEPINFGSSQQLAVLLYESMGLPILETTDTGEPATGSKVLEKLLNHASNNEILDCLKSLMELSKVTKILDSFIPAMEAAWLKADGYAYLHGSFSLGGTKSGRLSSSSPNMQNIPAHGPLAKLVKSCFVSPKGKIFASADYNALESKIDALTTKDPAKLDVFIYGYDSHAYNTYHYWKDKFQEVTLYDAEVTPKVYEVKIGAITHYIPHGTEVELPSGEVCKIEDYYATVKE